MASETFSTYGITIIGLSWCDSWSSHQDSEELRHASSSEVLVMRSKRQNKV